MEKSYFVRMFSREDYVRIWELSQRHSFVWQNKEVLDELLQYKNPMGWIIGVNMKPRTMRVIRGITVCAACVSSVGDRLVKIGDIEALLDKTVNKKS